MASAWALAICYLPMAVVWLWLWWRERKHWMLGVVQFPLLIGMLYLWIAWPQPPQPVYSPVARAVLFYMCGAGWIMTLFYMMWVNRNE
jgi:hypothetical protein